MNQKITSITVRDYKGVRGEITLKPSGSLVVIAGSNGSGKSSLIDAVAEIFDPKGTRLTARPINDNAEEASAEVITTEARLVRTWKKNDAGTLAAFALDGAKYPSGKDFVLAATGGALFDASEFVGMDARDQRAELLARVELPFSLVEIDAKRKGFFDARTDVTREVKSLTAQLAGLAALDESVPAEEVSATAILAEHETARRSNNDRQRALDNELDMESRVARLESELQQAKTELAEIVKAAQALPPTVDLEALSSQLANVEETNTRVRAQQKRAEIATELEQSQNNEHVLTNNISKIDKQKVDGLAAAKFPIAGLSVDDDGITFDGVPFKQVNTAKKIEIAFDLMTQQKPDLRLVMVKDGDALDAETLAGIDRVATERG